MVKDPVCGMAVNKKTPPARALYEGREYLFCSPHCKSEFQANPAAFAGGSEYDKPAGVHEEIKRKL